MLNFPTGYQNQCGWLLGVYIGLFSESYELPHSCKSNASVGHHEGLSASMVPHSIQWLIIKVSCSTKCWHFRQNHEVVKICWRICAPQKMFFLTEHRKQRQCFTTVATCRQAVGLGGDQAMIQDVWSDQTLLLRCWQILGGKTQPTQLWFLMIFEGWYNLWRDCKADPITYHDMGVTYMFHHR